MYLVGGITGILKGKIVRNRKIKVGADPTAKLLQKYCQDPLEWDFNEKIKLKKISLRKENIRKTSSRIHESDAQDVRWRVFSKR